MTNWSGASRTNYVHYTDKAALVKALEGFQIDMVFSEQEGTVMFMDSRFGEGDWPSSRIVDGMQEDFSFEEHIMPFVQEGEVLVCMQSGSEGHRYITGSAEAYVRKGGVLLVTSITLDDIYERAAREFDIETEINVAEY